MFHKRSPFFITVIKLKLIFRQMELNNIKCQYFTIVPSISSPSTVYDETSKRVLEYLTAFQVDPT
jgi:hypothetical protein